MAETCPYCGANNPIGTPFCTSCGEILSYVSSGLQMPMIGREEDFLQMLKILEQVSEEKQGRFILVTGEAGVGKTRLATELVSRLDRMPVTVIKGQSLSYQHAVSYGTFQDVLWHFLGITPDTPALQVREKLGQKTTQLLNDKAQETLPYLENLLALTPAESSLPRRIEYLEASQLHQQIFLAMRALLLAEANRRPLVVILEDIHWADESSLELLRFLLGSLQQAPLLIIGFAQSFQDGSFSGKHFQELISWCQENLVDRFISLTLQGLSPEQSYELLDQWIQAKDFPQSLLFQIQQKSRGNPLFIELLFCYGIDSGAFQRTEERWSINPNYKAPIQVPESLSEVILARVGLSSQLEKQILRIGSVIGQQFNLPLLRAVLSKPGAQKIQNALDRLTQRTFIHPQPESHGSVFLFPHTVIPDVIYETLTESDRTQMHGQIGEAIEMLNPELVESQVDVVARHFLRSDRQERALHYLILAGQKSARVYNNDAARAYFEEAEKLIIQVPSQPGQAIQVRLSLGDLLSLTGEYSVARQHYEQALNLITAESADEYMIEKCALYRKISATHERQGDYQDALNNLARGIHVLSTTPIPNTVEKALIFNDTGWIHFRLGNFEEAEKYLLNALSLAQQTSRFDVTASIFNRLGGVYWQTDQLAKASSFVQKSLALREEIGDTVAVARSYNNLGLLDWKLGKWDRAYENFQRCLELHSNLGDIEGVIDVEGNLGLLEIDRGQVDDARRHFEDALSKAQQTGHSFLVAMTLMYLSMLHVSIEEWQPALDYGEQSLKAFNSINALDELVDVYTNMGLACLGMGDIAQAKKWAADALLQVGQPDVKSGEGVTDGNGRILRLLGDISRAQHNYEQARRFYHTSNEIFGQLGNQLEQGRTTVAMASLAAMLQDDSHARVLLSEARLNFSQLGARLELQKLEKLTEQYHLR